MSANDVNGLPAVVQNNLPAAVNISSTTNATPIVVTTATNHGLTTGDYLTIVGATDTNANGDYIAGTVTPDTVSLQVIPTGANRAAAGGGGAAGTLQSLAFGVTYPIPPDLTQAMTASSVNVPFEALGDRTAYLLYIAGKARTATAQFSSVMDDNDGGPSTYATFSTSSYTDGLTIDVPDCVDGDTFSIGFTALADGVFTGTAALRIDEIYDYGGGGATAQAHISGALFRTIPQVSGTSPIPICMNAAATATASGAARFIVVGKIFAGTSLTLIAAYTISVIRFRPIP